MIFAMPLSCPSCGEENPDRARFCLACAAPLQAERKPPREKRKLVTVVFSDLSGSTSLGERLDSETLRAIMQRYYEAMRVALERHGGTVEKFIGDAVMAVFGVPTTREDDAVRAVRAARAMADSLAELNAEIEGRWGERLATRTGVNSGEVVAGAGVDALATGDAVNVAARLEQTAKPGEILIGETTRRLVGELAETEPAGKLELKGKAEPVAAHRLIALRDQREGQPSGHRSALRAALVGRRDELAALERAFSESVEAEHCRLVVLSGEPGVGKSRLCREFRAALADRARSLGGRCLSYGQGITYWSLAEIVKSAAGVVDQDSAEDAEAKIAAAVADRGRDRGRSIARPLAAAIGISTEPAEREDIFRAFRLFLESQAATLPQLIVVDDLQWAEPTFLDLIAYLVRNTEGPLLLLCLARPELYETHPDFGEELAEGAGLSIRLGTLSESDSRALVGELLGAASLPDELAAQITAAARGNPLFVEEMLRTMADEGQLVYEDGAWRTTGELTEVEVPATIQALLAARLERLEVAELEVAERASVIGEEFWRDAVEELSADGEDSAVAESLKALLAKELVEHGETEFLGAEPYRFSHLLVRDVAYSGLLKEVRAELHERFADWLDERLGERAGEYAEIIGYHLEAAYRHRSELGAADERTTALGERAGESLRAAGIRSFRRAESAAAVGLLERAVELLGDRPSRAAAYFWLGRALRDANDPAQALEALCQAASEAEKTGDHDMARLAKLRGAVLRVGRGEDRADEVRAFAGQILSEPSGSDDATGTAIALLSLMVLDDRALQCESAIARYEKMLASPAMLTEAGDAFGEYGIALQMGPVPVEQAIARIEAVSLRIDDSRPMVRAEIFSALAPLEASRRDFVRARSLCSAAETVYREFDRRLDRYWLAGYVAGPVEASAGELDVAEQLLTEGADGLRRLGYTEILASVLPDLARVLFARGRFDEAAAAAAEAREMTSSLDLHARIRWRSIEARLLAHRGEVGEAERIGREAVAIAAETDAVNEHACSLLDLAYILRAADRPEEARGAAREALGLYRGKGNIVGARQAEAALREVDDQGRSSSQSAAQ